MYPIDRFLGCNSTTCLYALADNIISNAFLQLFSLHETDGKYFCPSIMYCTIISLYLYMALKFVLVIGSELDIVITRQGGGRGGFFGYNSSSLN